MPLFSELHFVFLLKKNDVAMSLFDMFPGLISFNTCCLAHVYCVGFFLPLIYKINVNLVCNLYQNAKKHVARQYDL